MTNPKSVGRLPLTSRQESPPSSERMTSQCFCMNNTPGREGCSASRWTQWPTSALGSGIYWECSPRLIGRHVSPPSSLRNAPAAEIPLYRRRGSMGSSRILWHLDRCFRHAAPGRLPGRAAVVGALDHLAEPTTRLRRVQPVGIGRGPLDVINLPAREVRAADRPPTALAVGRENEGTFACADEDPNAAHDAIISAGSLPPSTSGV